MPQKAKTMKIKTITVTIDGVATQVAVLDASGLPVYILDDETEQAMDVPAMRTSLAAANAESAERKTKVRELETQVAAFKDIDPVKAKAALATVANLDNGQLVAIGKVDEAKKAVEEGLKAQYESTVTELRTQLETATTELANTTATLQSRDLSNMFKTSATTEDGFIKSKLALPLTAVEAVFSQSWKFEDGKWVAYYADGNRVNSLKNLGAPADFEEAMELLVKKHPDREAYMAGKVGGGGGANGGGGGGDADKDTNPFVVGGKAFNRTAQGKLIRENREEAVRLANAAGVKIPGLN